MQLWTEYEGVTIDGAFPLKKLLLPEGRSAFFSTTNSKGEQAFVRLIECHFDEEEILARWRSVEAFGHPNFLKLERYGQFALDGGTLVYAAFEKVDASLSDVLDQGRLSLPDTVQLASSLISALEMLHIHGFAHEHVEARNVFAVGDIVKLRSDCIREAPEAEAGLEAKRRDIHDFATVLLQALTQRKTLDAATQASLPAPFDRIVPNGLNGTWGFAEITVALKAGQKPSRSASATAAPPPPAAHPAHAAHQTQAAHQADAARQTGTARPAGVVEGTVLSPAKTKQAETRSESAARPAAQRPFAVKNSPRELSFESRWIAVAAFVGILVLLTGWLFAHNWRGHKSSASQAASASSRVTTRVGVQVAPAAASARGAAASSHAQPGFDRAAGGRTQWRVIVYTYDRENEAQKKSATIAQKHPDLRPAVFSPTGRAPYLVTIGGVMSRDEAFALARKSRGAGLPRDTYAQNYNSMQ